MRSSLVEHAPQRADGALEHGGERDVGHEARLLDLDARGFRFDASQVRQVDVVPAGEQIFDVPDALAMSNQYEFSGNGLAGHARPPFGERDINRSIAEMRVEAALAAHPAFAPRVLEQRQIRGAAPSRDAGAWCRWQAMPPNSSVCRRTPAFSSRAHEFLVFRAPALDRFVEAVDAHQVVAPEALVAALDGDERVGEPARQRGQRRRVQ